MPRRILSLLSICLATLFLVGCTTSPAPSKNKTVSAKVKLYYADQNNEKLISEEHQISYPEGADKYQAVLQQLIKGPASKTYRRNIPAGTRVYGTIKQNHDLIVDLSREFSGFPGSMAEIMAVGSVVNTMTQFKEITRVKILVEGEEFIGPSGQPRGFMKTFSNPSESLQESRQVILYFGNKDATAVAGEKRTIQLAVNSSREDLVKKILDELIKGPRRADLNRSIPAEVTVKSVQIKDSIAYIDFSQEMHSKHWGGAAGEAMTINSIVNTLTELDYIKKVKMTVEGKPLAIEHAILEEPVGRNEGMISR